MTLQNDASSLIVENVLATANFNIVYPYIDKDYCIRHHLTYVLQSWRSWWQLLRHTHFTFYLEKRPNLH